MNEIHITVAGSVTMDPEVSITQSGATLCSFSIATSVSRFNQQTNSWENQDPTFIRVTAWRKLAENAGKSLQKGTAVLVSGTLENNRYEKDGQSHNGGMRITATNIGVDLRNATAKVERNSNSNQNTTSQNFTSNQPQVQAPQPQADVPTEQNPSNTIEQGDPFEVHPDVSQENSGSQDENNPFGEAIDQNSQTQSMPF